MPDLPATTEFPEILDADIVAASAAIDLPVGRYCLLRPDAADELQPGRPIYEALAAERGAVVFLEGVPFQDEGRPVVVLRVETPWAILERDGERVGIETFAPLDPTLPWRFVAFSDFPEDTVVVAGGSVTEVAGGSFKEDADRPGVWASDHWQIRPHPLGHQPRCRDWAWSWGRQTWGPVDITVWIAQTAAELAAWLATLAPMPYALREPGVYVATRPALLRELRISDGSIELLRDYQDPPDAYVAFEANLLLALAARDELLWDVSESDYGSVTATGNDGASLREYLDPTSDSEAQKARWAQLLTPRECDAHLATTRAELLSTVARCLGATAPIDDFRAWLAAQPLGTLPHAILLIAPKAFESDYQWFFELVHWKHVKWSIAFR